MRSRRVAAWLLSFPLMVAGSQVAHVLAYAWVYPSAHVRLGALLSTGHGYMVGAHAYLPILLGVLLGAELVGAGWVFAGSVRRSLQRPVPAWAFALLPLAGFSLQELLERWLAGDPSPWLMALAPTFRVGLLLQLPFALAVYLLARLLLRAATEAGRELQTAVERPRSFGLSLHWVGRAAPARPPTVIHGEHSGRSPPRLLAPQPLASSH